ncbi:3-dehydroquinate synthase [Ekhidna sp.]|uniref:3-dehydroquinate synthase n=1 Tax=Ekhidna sp. TaxID=2608089 RepID=UPI003B5C1CBC
MSNNLPSYLTISQGINTDLIAAIETLKPDKIAVLVDENTRKYCLPHLHQPVDVQIEIQSGEKYKTLDTCTQIWERLTESGFTRKSLLINLGGGVIGDMGGFAAATFKRGMPFINIPTTLLSQVDASIGGKLGIDFNGLKNHVGLFQDPARVLIYPGFLKTLPQRELKSGFAEVIKHALISNTGQWEYLLNNSFESMDWNEIIPKSIGLKNEVVQKDPKENGLRKILNYGHTIGHVMETYFLKSSSPLLHGEAIALGMVKENEIAEKLGLISQSEVEEIQNYLERIYDFPKKLPGFNELIEFLVQDKKNDREGLRFSLLTKVGSCTYDVQVEQSILKQVLK